MSKSHLITFVPSPVRRMRNSAGDEGRAVVPLCLEGSSNFDQGTVCYLVSIPIGNVFLTHNLKQLVLCTSYEEIVRCSQSQWTLAEGLLAADVGPEQPLPQSLSRSRSPSKNKTSRT